MFGGYCGRLAALLVWLGVLVTLQQQHHVFVASKVTCKLKIEGARPKPGLKTAELSCSGGTITAAANPMLRPFIHAFRGVQWSDKGACGQQKKDCLLMVCGNSTAAFVFARVAQVNVSMSNELSSVVCVGDLSSLTFKDARFERNDLRPLAGYGQGIRVHILSSRFMNNSASWSEAVGGALSVNGGTVLVESSTFSGNLASYRGGAINLVGTSSTRITSTALQHNIAEGCGGLYVSDTASAIITNTTFAHNHATDGGAVGLWDNATAQMVAVVINGNTADYAAGIDVEGNAVLHLQETHLISNVAAKSGGALYAAGNSRVLATSCTVSNNTAQTLHGGGMFADDSCLLLLNGTNFTDNHAVQGWGGALMVNGSAVVKAKRVAVVHNIALLGAGVCLEAKAHAKFTGSVLGENLAINDGGAVSAAGSSVLTVEGCSLHNNSADNDDSGGAAAFWDNTTGTFKDTFMAGNMAGYGGALSVSNSAQMSVTNATLLDNHAYHNGGGMQVSGGFGQINMSNCRLINNSAASRGGGINVIADAAINLTGSTRGVGNMAIYGGFMAMDGTAHAYVLGARLADNYGTLRGGVLYALNQSVSEFEGCDIIGGRQQPEADGGVANIDDNATILLSSCRLSGLHANRGAGLAIFGSSSAHVHNCTVREAAAVMYGGCIFASQNATAVWAGGSIVDTHANAGGAVNALANSRVAFINTMFSNATSRTAGGALYFEHDASLNLTGCTFQSCTAVEGGGAVLVKDRTHTHMVNCTLSHCSSRNFGGGALAASGNAQVDMHACGLRHNTAAKCGGAVVIEGRAHVHAERCEIAQNSCGDCGGGAAALGNGSLGLLDGSVHTNVATRGGGIALNGRARLRILNTPVEGNRATGWGGGIILGSDNFVPAQIKLAVRHNQARLVADVSAQPLKLLLSNSSNTESFVSRLGSDDGLVKVTLKATGPRDLPSESVSVKASLDGVVLLTQETAVNGSLLMPVKLRKPPGGDEGSYTLQFHAANYDEVPPVNVTVHVVNCSQGDVTVSSGDACQWCAFGSYSFNPRNNTCDECVPNAECPGGAQILPLAGFWHSSPYSAQMHRCFNTEACPGGANNTGTHGKTGDVSDDYKTSQCSPGYGGNLCALCQPGYGTVKPFTCKACMKPAVTIALYTLAALVMLVAVRVLSALALADSGGGATNQAKPVDLVKPLVVYAQWLFVVVNINGVPWPKTLSYPLQALGWFWSSASSNSLGLDCVLPRGIGIPVAGQKVLFGLLMPLAILTVLLGIELVVASRAWGRRTRRHSVNTVERVASLCTCMVFLFLPTWSHTAFSLFTCAPLDTPTQPPYAAEAVGSWWAQDMGEECYAPGGYHRAWALGIGIPLLLLLCFVLPAGLFAFLLVSKKSGKLCQDGFRQHYGFLYRTWHERVCWWEAVVVLQTICLVMVGTFGHALGPYYHALVMMAALGMIGVLLMSVKPHKSAAAGIVSLQSIGVLYLTTYSALTFLPYRNITPAPGYSTTMGVVVLVLHVAFVLSTLWKLARLINWGTACRFVGWFCRNAAAPCCRCWQHTGRTGRLPECHCLDVFELPLWLQPGVTASGCCVGKSPIQETAAGDVPANQKVADVQCKPPGGW